MAVDTGQVRIPTSCRTNHRHRVESASSPSSSAVGAGIQFAASLSDKAMPAENEVCHDGTQTSDASSERTLARRRGR